MPLPSETHAVRGNIKKMIQMQNHLNCYVNMQVHATEVMLGDDVR